jgi:hypothetical protein
MLPRLAPGLISGIETPPRLVTAAAFSCHGVTASAARSRPCCQRRKPDAG